MPSDATESFMHEAIKLALHSIAQGGGPFGAVVVRDGQIIGRGHNRVTLNNDPTAHAEVEAIRDACARLGTFKLDGCVIYASCMPCPMCLGAAYWAHAEHIYFATTSNDAAEAGFDDAFIYQELLLPPAQRSLPLTQICQHEAQSIFSTWQSKQDRVDY